MNRSDSPDLRRRAERVRAMRDLPSKAGLDPLKVLHELQVHQIELELQNEDLIAANRELDAARTRYRTLYELAPVGYVTVSRAGVVEELNLRAAEMLGNPDGVVGQPLRNQFEEAAPAIDALLSCALETGFETFSEPLLLKRARALPIYVKAQAQVIRCPEANSVPVVLVAMMDVSALKFATEDVLSVLRR